MRKRPQRFLLGAPRSIPYPAVPREISLIAIPAWVGLGAGRLTLSAYGPDEVFGALGSHTYPAASLASEAGFLFVFAQPEPETQVA